MRTCVCVCDGYGASLSIAMPGKTKGLSPNLPPCPCCRDAQLSTPHGSAPLTTARPSPTSPRPSLSSPGVSPPLAALCSAWMRAGDGRCE